MRKSSLLILIPLLILGLTACNNEPVFPTKPKIEFLDIQPKRVKSLDLSTPITITFKFQDGDGNLGILDSNITNLELIDSRINNGLTPAEAIIGYSIPNLTPDAKKPSIQGEITIEIPLTVVVNPQNQEEEIRYQIKFWDRDGNLATPINESADNSVYTDYITVFR